MPVRHRWMDLFRGMAILLVVTLHAVTIPHARGIESFGALKEFFLFLSPLRVPVLFALSGMLLPGALRKAWPVYVSGKVRNLLWPFLLWGVITVLLVGKRSQFSKAWEWIGGFGHLWFLGTLLFCVAVGWTVRVVPAWVYVVAFPLILALVDISVPDVEKWLFYGTFYFAGATLWRWRQVIAAAGAWLPVLSVAVGIAGCFVAGDSPIEKFGFLGLLAPLPWFFAILWAGPRLPRVPVLESMGRNSVIWYCAHFPALGLAIAWGMRAGLEGVAVNLVALGAGVGLPLALVLAGRWARPLFALPSLRALQGRAQTRTPAPEQESELTSEQESELTSEQESLEPASPEQVTAWGPASPERANATEPASPERAPAREPAFSANH